MESSKRAQADLAARCLPPPLFKAIVHVFQQELTGVALVGGTALSGYYAGHRRSDDMDLFVKDDFAYKATVLAVKSLTKVGGVLSDERQTKQYFNSRVHLEGHYFTVDVVTDPQFFTVGSFEQAGSVTVASLETLFKMKAATLISRCSEKDLYDLLWLFQHFKAKTIKDLVIGGSEIDGGLTGESLLISLAGTKLDKRSCDFSIRENVSAQRIFDEISAFKIALEQEISQYLRTHDPGRLGKLIGHIKREFPR